MDWCAAAPVEVVTAAKAKIAREMADSRTKMQKIWDRLAKGLDDEASFYYTCSVCAIHAHLFDSVCGRENLGVPESNDVDFWHAALGFVSVFSSHELVYERFGPHARDSLRHWREMDQRSLAEARFDWGPWSGPALRVAWEWTERCHVDLFHALQLCGVVSEDEIDPRRSVTDQELLARPGALIDALDRVRQWRPTESDINKLFAQIDREQARRRGTSSELFLPASTFGPTLAVRLRKATAPGRKSKRVRSRLEGELRVYALRDVCKWWPTDVPRELRSLLK